MQPRLQLVRSAFRRRAALFPRTAAAGRRQDTSRRWRRTRPTGRQSSTAASRSVDPSRACSARYRTPRPRRAATGEACPGPRLRRSCRWRQCELPDWARRPLCAAMRDGRGARRRTDRRANRSGQEPVTAQEIGERDPLPVPSRSAPPRWWRPTPDRPKVNAFNQPIGNVGGRAWSGPTLDGRCCQPPARPAWPPSESRACATLPARRYSRARIDQGQPAAKPAPTREPCPARCGSFPVRSASRDGQGIEVTVRLS